MDAYYTLALLFYVPRYPLVFGINFHRKKEKKKKKTTAFVVTLFSGYYICKIMVVIVGSLTQM